MVNSNSHIDAFASRLRAARKGLGLDQSEFGALGGVHRTAQSKYERAESTPDTAYLLRIGEAGVDVSELLTGVPTETPVYDASEIEIITLLRTTPEDVRASIATILRRCAEHAPPAKSTLHSGSSSFAAEGDKR